MGGKFGRLVDDLAHFRVGSLEFVLARPASREQTRPDLLDRIALSADLFDLLAGAVFCRIRHGVTAVAVGHHLQNDGTVAVTAPFHGPFTSRPDGAHVHAVDLLARDIEGQAAPGKIDLGGGAGHGRAHGVAVVLDDVDHGELPQLRHVEAFVHLALVGRAVAEIGQTYTAVLAVAIGKGDAGAERDLGCDDAMAAVEIFLDAEHVHRAAFPLGVAAASAGQFSHDALRVHAAGQHVPVVAVSGDDLIAGSEGELHAHDHGFLPDIEMAEAADQPHAVHLTGSLLETADHQHVAINAKLHFLAQVGRRIGNAVA